MELPQKLKAEHTMQQFHCWEIELSVSLGNLHHYAQCIPIHNNQEKENDLCVYWLIEDNKHVVHIYNKILLRHKSNKIQAFVTVKMELEVMESERVQAQIDKYKMISLHAYSTIEV